MSESSNITDEPRICANPKCDNVVPPQNKKFCTMDCWKAVQPKIDQWQGLEFVEQGLRKKAELDKAEFEARRRKWDLKGAEFGIKRIANPLCQGAFAKVNKLDSFKPDVIGLFKMKMGHASHEAIEEALEYQLIDELPIKERPAYKKIEYKRNEFFTVGYYIDMLTNKRVIEIKTMWQPKAFIKTEKWDFIENSPFVVYQPYSYMFMEGSQKCRVYAFYFLAQALLTYDYTFIELQAYYDNTPYGKPIDRMKDLHRRIKEKDFTPDPIIDHFGMKFFCEDCINWYCPKYVKKVKKA